MKKPIFSILIFSLIFGCYTGCNKNVPIDIKKSQIENNFKTALPVGSSVQKVLVYLNQNKIEHDIYHPKSHTISAIIREVERDIVVITDIQISFNFNQKDRLTDFSLKGVYAGP